MSVREVSGFDVPKPVVPGEPMPPWVVVVPVDPVLPCVVVVPVEPVAPGVVLPGVVDCCVVSVVPGVVVPEPGVVVVCAVARPATRVKLARVVTAIW